MQVTLANNRYVNLGVHSVQLQHCCAQTEHPLSTEQSSKGAFPCTYNLIIASNKTATYSVVRLCKSALFTFVVCLRQFEGQRAGHVQLFIYARCCLRSTLWLHAAFMRDNMQSRRQLAHISVTCSMLLFVSHVAPWMSIYLLAFSLNPTLSLASFNAAKYVTLRHQCVVLRHDVSSLSG